MTSKNDVYLQITALLSSGQLREAEEAISKAQNTLPLPVFLECVGNLHFYRRDIRQAIGKYQEALQADPGYQSARHHYLAGVKCEQEGDLIAAFKHYQAAIEIEPSFVDAYVELGGMLGKADDFEGALTCYTDALDIDQSDLSVWHNRCEVLRVLSDRDPEQYSAQYNVAARELEEAKTRLPALDESHVW